MTPQEQAAIGAQLETLILRRGRTISDVGVAMGREPGDLYRRLRREGQDVRPLREQDVAGVLSVLGVERTALGTAGLLPLDYRLLHLMRSHVRVTRRFADAVYVDGDAAVRRLIARGFARVGRDRLEITLLGEAQLGG